MVEQQYIQSALNHPDFDAGEPVTRYGLRRVAHKVNKDSTTVFVGAITFETTVPLLDETDAGRDLEVLLISGRLNVFGTEPRLSDMSFNWATRLAETPDGEPFRQLFCTVTLSYISNRQILDGDEMIKRLIEMGYTLE